MEGEHVQLSYSLYKKYILIMVVSVLVFCVALVSINHLFLLADKEYMQHPFNANAKLNNIINEGKLVGNNIAAVIEQQNGVNSLTSGSFCNSSITYAECVTQMGQSEVNNAIKDETGTSTSFRCIAGDCLAVGHLSDYFWTYKIRYSFIDYIHIKYSNSSTLLIPAVAVESVQTNSLSFLSTWKLTYVNTTIALSLGYSGTMAIDIAIVLDSAVMKSKYGLDLAQSDFAQSTQPLSHQKQLHYQFQRVLYLILYLIMLIVSCVVVALRGKALINQWADASFTNLHALDSLYRYQLDCMFTGKQPDNSTILCESAMSNFYEDLSDLIDKSYETLTVRSVEVERQEPFKFGPLLERVIQKYDEQMRRQQEQRNRELADLKYQIKGAVSQIVQNVAKKLKDSFSKAKQLRIGNVFFYHAYLSLLETNARYELRLRQQDSALPESLISLFRYMNSTINSDNIKFPFKFAGIFTKTIEEELTMKLQFHLQQKYLSQLKELDFGLIYCKKLGLEKEIKYLQESIDNKKYIFTTYLK